MLYVAFVWSDNIYTIYGRTMFVHTSVLGQDIGVHEAERQFQIVLLDLKMELWFVQLSPSGTGARKLKLTFLPTINVRVGRSDGVLFHARKKIEVHGT